MTVWLITLQLLQRTPSERLGFGPSGGDDIKAHKFFADIDWKMLYDKDIRPDFVPVVKSKTDTSNVDSEFTSEAVVDSVVPESKLTAGAAAKFEDFTFAPKGMGGGAADLEKPF